MGRSIVAKPSFDALKTDTDGSCRYETQAEVLKAEFEKLHGLAKKKKTASGKPISGYARYVKENFGDAKKGMPKASTPEVMKELAKQWNGLSESQKGKYKAG